MTACAARPPPPFDPSFAQPLSKANRGKTEFGLSYPQLRLRRLSGCPESAFSTKLIGNRKRDKYRVIWILNNVYLWALR